jgi:hypothetical protein
MDITITIPDAQLPRVTAYVRSKFLLEPDPETGEVPPEPTNQELIAEFKRIIRLYIKGEVQQYELLEQHKASFDAYTPIDPT